MSELPRAGEGIEALLLRIGTEYPKLSRQLQAIARYVEQHHDALGLERIQDVADRCGVQPSAVVRFAKHFGFSGYHAFKQMLRDGIEQQIAPNRAYQARLREHLQPAGQAVPSNADIAHAFIDGAIAGLRDLQRDLQPSALDDAVTLLLEAAGIWIVGARRAFPVAAYLAYALQHGDKPVHFVSQFGSMHLGQTRGVREGDVVLAVSFAPYAEETLAAAQAARTRGGRVIALTDSRFSPLAVEADVLLLMRDPERLGFRSLTNSMALAQSLFIALAARLEQQYRI